MGRLLDIARLVGQAVDEAVSVPSRLEPGPLLDGGATEAQEEEAQEEPHRRLPREAQAVAELSSRRFWQLYEARRVEERCTRRQVSFRLWQLR